MTVSVIIPTYNSSAFVGKAIESILAQSLMPQEIILVDNNSTDNTLQVLKEYAAKYPELIHVTSEKVQGPSAARNKGLQKAKGTWIQFLDSDDTLPSNKLAGQLYNCPVSAEWIVGGYREIEMNGSHQDYLPQNDLWLGLVTGRGIGCSCSNLFRRSLLVAHGGYRLDWPDAEDHDLYFRLLSGNRLKPSDKPLKISQPWIDSAICCYVYDRPTNKQSRNNLSGHLKRRFELHLRLHKYLQQHQPSYYSEQESLLKLYLINNYRYWAAYDQELAIMAAEQFFPSTKTWPRWQSGILPAWIYWTYRWLGFRRTEWFRNFFR